MSSLDNDDLYFYAIYASKYNRESLHDLKYKFNFLEISKHKEFIEAQEDLEEEANKEALNDRRS